MCPNSFFLNYYLYPRFREKLGVKTVKALKRNNNGVTHAAVDMLCALMCVSVVILFWIDQIDICSEQNWAFVFCSLRVMFAHSRCTTTMTWGKSNWTRPLCSLQRSFWKTCLKNSSLMWYIFLSLYCQTALRRLRRFILLLKCGINPSAPSYYFF